MPRIRSIVSVAGIGWLTCLGTMGAPASAGSFTVSPVQITLPADRKAAVLRMTNRDASPISVRVVTYGWTQVDGFDVYSATGNVIVSPPMFTIPAGQTQHVRIGLKSRQDGGAYRVVFEEIPLDRPADGQVQITLRMNLPLYVLPKGRAAADVAWTAWRDRSGDLVVEGRNRGLLHAQVIELGATRLGRRQVLSTQMGVVLPGSARQWKIARREDFAAGAPFLLNVRGPTGDTQAQIVLGQR